MTRKGFTLIELLVVVAVLALLASIVFSNLGGAREGARISNALSFQSQTHSLLGSDLVGWWNFNDSSGRYKDISGYGNDGSCTSCPTPVDGVPGTGGMAMEFDGGENQIDSTPFIAYNKTTTYSAWFNSYSLDQKRAIFGHVMEDGGGYSSYACGGFFQNTNGSLRGSVITSSQAYVSIDYPMVKNTWFYAVFVKNMEKGTVSLYVNGEFIDEKNFDVENLGIWSGSQICNNRRVAIGYYNPYSFLRFHGLIDDVRIYSRALTAFEVQGLYAQTKGNYVVK